MPGIRALRGAAVEKPHSDMILTQNGYASLSRPTWNPQMNAEESDVGELKL